jgi:hypothetical protein
MYILLRNYRHRRAGHSLMELVAAMVASGMLLAGLGSVVLIGRQVAYTPMGAIRRTEAANVVSLLTDELQHATLVIGQSANVLEFVVTDRNADGTAEKIRYEWSGTNGHPLRKSINGGSPVTVLETVNNFNATYLLEPKSTALTTTTESAEAVLGAIDNVQSGSNRSISASSYSAHQIFPWAFSGIPANAICWNATKLEFQAQQNPPTTETLLVQLRSAGEAYQGPTSDVLGQASIPETSLAGTMNWNTATFPSPIRGLSLARTYMAVWSNQGSGSAALLLVNDSAPSGVLESNDSGASWQYMTTRQMYGRIYGTYTTPGTTYNVTRNFVTHVRLVLQAGGETHARIDASVPLTNTPEVLSTYWRTDFDRNPTTTNANGDASADWAMAGGASFDTAMMINGIWYATGALETRPLHDFTQTTIVESRCRNSSVGGNGTVLRINADRQGGQYAPILIYLRRLSDGTQTLSLNGKTSDSVTKELFSRSRLSEEFVRVRLVIVPQNNIVNLTINDEDQGTFTYPTYAPSSTTDRFVTLYGDTSQAEFDYVDVRVAN